MSKKAERLPNVEDLTNHDPQTVANDLMIPVIWCDHQATRRQKLHGANIPGHDHCYSSSHINECLEHVAEAGFNDAIFICETPRRTHLACFIEFQAIPSKNDRPI